MENTPPQDIFVSTISTKEYMDDVDTVYSCMKRYPSGDPLLGEFRDIDTIRSQFSLLQDPHKRTVYLVYGDDSDKAGQEVCFRVAGYIAAFDLPGHGITKRYATVRHSLLLLVSL